MENVEKIQQRSARARSKGVVGIQAIATSDGVDDDGLFELNFHDERYLPFEFSGAVSRWHIELPPENNEFDLDTISDVVLKLNNTAREGGQELRKKASECARKQLPGNGIRYFDIRHEFQDAWRIFTCPPLGHRDFDLRLSRNLFPFLTSCRTVCIKHIHLFIEKDCYAGSDCTGDHIGLSFHPHRRPRDCVGDDNGKREFVCRAAADTEMVYHGFFGLVSPLPLRGYVSEPVGKLRLARGLEGVGGG